MFCNFYLMKSHKIANNSKTAKAREKISIVLESLKFYEFFLMEDMYVRLNLKTIQFNKQNKRQISVGNQAILLVKQPHCFEEMS
jgi:hypothetical protein